MKILNVVIGPYFFESDEGNAITVNSEHYRSMMENFFWPELAEMDLRNMWFQQDGATCHTSHQTINSIFFSLGFFELFESIYAYTEENGVSNFKCQN